MAAVSFILDRIHWQTTDEKSTCVFIDDGFMESLKWQFGNVIDPRRCPTFHFSRSTWEDAIILQQITILKPKRILFFISEYLVDAVDRIKFFLGSACVAGDEEEGVEAIVLTTTQPSAVSAMCISPSPQSGIVKPPKQVSVDREAGYSSLVGALQPVTAQIFHFPLNTVPLNRACSVKVQH